MAAKQPPVGIDHLTVVPADAPPADGANEMDGDDEDADDADADEDAE